VRNFLRDARPRVGRRAAIERDSQMRGERRGGVGVDAEGEHFLHEVRFKHRHDPEIINMNTEIQRRG